MKHPEINRKKVTYKKETHKNLHLIHYTKCWITNGSENKYVNKTDIIPEGWYKGRTYTPKKEYKNHKILKIERINKPCRVYDLEIEDNHNFALDIGVFVHNSKDILDSLVGSVYSASKFLKMEDIGQLDNYTAIYEANELPLPSKGGPSYVNQFFTEFQTKNDLTETEKKNKQIDEEITTIRKLRDNLDPEDQKNITDQQLIDLYNSNFEGDDMLLF